MDSDVLRVVYASDDKFAEIMGVSMTSLLENNKDFEEIFAYVLDGGISQKEKVLLADLFRGYGRKEPLYIPAINVCQELGLDIKADRGSILQYAHLFLESAFPQDFERILYLDSDILVLKSLKELWTMDLQGKTLGALQDAFSKYYRKNIGLQPKDTYFNAGMFLVDLRRWKELKIEEKLKNFLRERGGKVQQADQGTLNGVLSKEVCCFDPKYNAVTIFFDFSYRQMLRYRRPPEYYSKEKIENAVRDPSVVHFTTSFLSRRPWVENCEHKYATKWLYYKFLSPWRDRPLWKDKRPKWKQLLPKIPRWMLIPIVSFLQVYVRPLTYRAKKKAR